MRYLSGVDDTGNTIDIRDPLAQKIQDLVEKNSQTDRVSALLTLTEIFSNDLPNDEQFVRHVSNAWNELCRHGARKAVENLLQ